MSNETKLGTVIGLIVVVMLAVINAAPRGNSTTEPANNSGGTPPRISLAAPE
jgi:hypothetical protein